MHREARGQGQDVLDCSISLYFAIVTWSSPTGQQIPGSRLSQFPHVGVTGTHHRRTWLFTWMLGFPTQSPCLGYKCSSDHPPPNLLDSHLIPITLVSSSVLLSHHLQRHTPRGKRTDCGWTASALCIPRAWSSHKDTAGPQHNGAVD